jgi:tRNA threonylcarbamoyladenosine biosynthesis protein TsaE
MVKKEVVTNSPQETRKLGYFLGKKAIKEDNLVFICLSGELGGGKTTFTQGFAKGLGVKDNITSPTFLVFKKYKTKDDGFFYHFDAYRIEEKDLPVLGFREIVNNKKNIIIVEWGENIKKSLPENRTNIFFKAEEDKKRKLIIEGDSDIIKN